MDDIWQLLYPEHFINILLIHHIKQRREEDIEKIASIMRHGLKHYDDRPLFQFSEHPFALNDDQHYYKKFKTSKISDMFESFQSEDGSTIKPKRILIDGAPGMGKTTLCKEIVYQWAKGELLTDSKIVFLLFLRDPEIEEIHNLKDFIHYFYKFEPLHGDTSKKCAEILKERDNSDITIVMDGYDEYSDKDDLLITKIIKRRYMPQCRIVITSRPIASEKLQKLADVRVEILGFTDQSKKEYIQKELKDYPKKIKTFLSYLDNHSSINQLCFIPIMMTIMVCCFKQYEELPTNETEVYERFVTLAISHCLQRIDSNLPTKILSLNKLPEKYQENLKQLSEFAFKTIENDRIIFSNEDMERLSPTLALSSRENQGLGLLKVTEHFNTIKMDECIWYNFLHLSIHEFLAAYYLKSLEPHKQFQILNKHVFITRYTNVWVMFLGLQQNETYRFDQYLTYTHMFGASDATKDQIKLILQKLHRLPFSAVKNININGIKGTFQLLCYKDKDLEDDHQTDHENLSTQIDTWKLFLPFMFMFNWSIQTTLFASLCSVDNNDQLIEIFLLDKISSNMFYYKVVRGLEENQNLSVVLLSSDTLVGYRSNFHQLNRALNINRPLQCLILRYCIMNSNTAHALSSCIINSSHLQDLHIVNCKFTGDQSIGFSEILKALAKHSQLKVLNLNYTICSMTAKVAKDLANVIKNNLNLKCLGLDCINLKPHADVILQALAKSTKLEILNLKNNNMTGKVAEDLANVIANNPNLELLNLEKNKLGPSAVIILQTLAKCCKLEVLNLLGIDMTELAVKDLENVIKNNQGLKDLTLSDNQLKTFAVVVLKALKVSSLLKVLHLNDTLITEEATEDLADVIKNNTHLEELHIANNLGVSAVVILQALTRISNLKVLNLNGNKLTGQVVEHLVTVIKNNSGLEQLYLSYNDFKSSVSVILKVLKETSRLNILHLNDNVMTEEVAKDLADVIINNNHLKQLCIANNKLGVSAAAILQALTRTSNLRVLNLNGSNLTGQVVEHLVSVIKNNSCLEELYLLYNDFKSSVSVILKALKENSRLNILHLNDNLMAKEAAEDLADVIKNNTRLKQLCIANNNFGVSAAVILQALTRTSNLKVLDLNRSNLTGQVVEHLVSVIKNNSGLEELYLSYNDFESSVSTILKALKENSKLNILHLNDNVMTEEAAEDLADVIKNNTHLKQLCIANNKLGVSAAVIIQALTRTSNLKVLNLNGSNLTGQVVEHLVSVIKNNSGLEQLYLSYNDFKSSVSVIFKALKENSRLNILHLNDNVMTEEAAQDLADVIKNNTHLKQLSIRNNKLGVSAAVILQALTRTSNLKVLNLNGSNLTGQVVEHLVSVIKNNSGLEQLYLSYNDFKSSVSAIFKALKENSRLNILNLNDNVMTEEAAKDLADVIKNNTCLKQLSIRNNKLGVSAAVILQALTRTSNLKVLNLNGSNLTGQVIEHLVSVIKNNSGLEQLYLSYNDFKSSVSVIFKALKENSRLNILYLNDDVMTEEAAEDLADVIKNNTHLKQLCIANIKLGVSAAVILQALIRTSKLEGLNLNGSNLNGQVVEHLVSVIKNNSGLEQLYLSYNDFKSSVSAIFKALKENSRLNILHLNDNVMTEETAKDLADVIKNNTHLKQLYIANNKLGVSAAVILQALTKFSNLKVLNLNGSNLTEQLVGDLINVIRNNLNLEELYLSNNDLQSSVFVILQALKQNSELKILNLSSNNVTGLVVKDLISAIKFSSNLQEITLNNNNLQLSSVMILQALKENCKLKVLNLGSNNMNGLVSKDLASVIKNNPSLEELDLSENNLKSSVIMIFHALKETSTLKVICLMSNNMTREVAGDLASVLKNNPNLEDLRIRNNYLGSSAVKLLQALTKISKLKILNLISNNLTAEISHDLAKVIRINSGLECFYLSDTNLKSSAVVILQALKLNSQLKELYLRNFLTESVRVELVSILKSNPLITELWLGNNLLQSGLIDIAKTCNNLTNLHALELSCNNINSMEVLKLVSAIAKLNLLQVLVLGGLIFDVKERFYSHLCNIIKQKYLFQKTDIDNEILKGMCLEMWRLQFAGRIKVNHCIRNFFPKNMINVQMIPFYAEKMSSIALSIVEQSEKKLSQLDATKMLFSLSVIIKPLKVLDLEYSNIRKEAAVELATALGCNNVLEQLWLRGNVLSADGAAVILTSLQNITTLRVLDLSYNNISSRSANGIAAVINSNHFLEQLWLDGNMLMTTGVVIIASALKKHSNLRLLSLSNNEITEDAAEEISAIVNSNNLLGGLLLSNNQLQFTHLSKTTKPHGGIQFLHILELSNNFINATAADELAVTLSSCVCLKELYLGNNNLGTTGGVKIFQAVKNIPILQVLSLNNNNITTEAASEICDVINTNINLDILLLGGNDLQTSGVLQIADTVKNNNPTMQLLSLSDNNVDEQVKEDIKVMLCDQCDLELFI